MTSRPSWSWAAGATGDTPESPGDDAEVGVHDRADHVEVERDATAAATRRTRRAASPTNRLALATKAGANHELLRKLLDLRAAEPDAAEIDVLLCGMGEQARMLRDGRAGVALMQRPFDTLAGFDTEDLATERRVAILPAGHPLAARSSLTMADISNVPDLPVARWPRHDGTYEPGAGPEIHDQSQLAQLIALGRTMAVLCAPSRSWLWKAHTAVPLTDAPLVTTVLAWPPHARSRAVPRSSAWRPSCSDRMAYVAARGRPILDHMGHSLDLGTGRDRAPLMPQWTCGGEGDDAAARRLQRCRSTSWPWSSTNTTLQSRSSPTCSKS